MRDALETHLRYEPTKVSESRIKRLRGLSRPQYRLRVDDIRVFYDVTSQTVEILAIVSKAAGVLIGFETEEDWLDHRLEHDPEFLQRIAEARAALRRDDGVKLEDLPAQNCSRCLTSACSWRSRQF